MTIAVRVSDKLVKDARLYSKVDNSFVTGQIEYWARIVNRDGCPLKRKKSHRPNRRFFS